jgi:hypothetical protein
VNHLVAIFCHCHVQRPAVALLDEIGAVSMLQAAAVVMREPAAICGKRAL